MKIKKEKINNKLLGFLGKLKPACVLIPLLSTTVYAENLVANSGFESNTSGWSVSGTTSAQLIESSGLEGNRLTHYSSSSNYSVDTFQTISGLTAGTYRLSAHSVGGASAEAYLYASDCGGENVQSAIPAIAWGDWTEIVVDNIQVSSADCTIGIHTANSEWTSIDNVSFELVSSSYPENSSPGLEYGTVTGNINTTDANPKDSITTSLSETEDAIESNTTEIYTGYIYDADGVISFMEDMDDKTRLWIDGNLVLSDDAWNSQTDTGLLSLTPGWHAFELRISNGNGGSGPTGTLGFGYDPEGGYDFVHLSDPGDGSLLRFVTVLPEANTAVSILANHGFNYARIRLLVNPPNEYGLHQDLDYVIALAKEAKDNNMKILLDIFYSDWWADPGNNWAPSAWSSLDLATLQTTVYSYTQDVLNQMDSEGVLPDMVQVGNENSGGMCWGLGNVSNSDGWANYVSLSNQGYDAVKSVSASIPVIIHYPGVGSGATDWYTNFIDVHKGKADALGLSFYEIWHGRISGAVDTINTLHDSYQKPVYIVETAAYWTASDKGETTYHDHDQDGQYDALFELANAVKNLEGFAGVFYWGATWSQSTALSNADVTWLDAPTWADDDASTRSLFDHNAQATRAIDAFKDAGGISIIGADVSEAHYAESKGVEYKDR